jgi:hypothetical protein
MSRDMNRDRNRGTDRHTQTGTGIWTVTTTGDEGENVSRKLSQLRDYLPSRYCI